MQTRITFNVLIVIDFGWHGMLACVIVENQSCDVYCVRVTKLPFNHKCSNVIPWWLIHLYGLN